MFWLMLLLSSCAMAAKMLSISLPCASRELRPSLDSLIKWGWVKSVGRKDDVYELTGTGYKKADWLKDGMGINTDNDPLDELKEYDG